MDTPSTLLNNAPFLGLIGAAIAAVSGTVGAVWSSKLNRTPNASEKKHSEAELQNSITSQFKALMEASKIQIELLTDKVQSQDEMIDLLRKKIEDQSRLIDSLRAEIIRLNEQLGRHAEFAPAPALWG